MTEKFVVTPPTETAGALLSTIVRTFGAMPAVHDPSGTTSFIELEAASLRVAQGLLAAGVAKGAHVGILMGNDAEYLAALFGTLRIGAVAVLLSTLARGPELASLVRTSDVDTLLMHDRYLNSDFVSLLEDAFPDLAGSDGGRRLMLPQAPFLRAIWVWSTNPPAWSRGDGEALCEGATREGIGAGFLALAEAEVVPADRAVMICTSGSTAEPKAVVHTHANLIRKALGWADLCDLRPGGRVLSTSPFFWVGGLCTVMLASFASGSAVVCPAGPSIDAISDSVATWRPTNIMQWPHQFEQMRGRPEIAAALADVRPASSAQYALLGLAPPELVANALGMTEALGPHSGYSLELLAPGHEGSFGIAIVGFERRIVDPETGEECMAGDVGELWIRGGTLMHGIHRKERREVFTPDGFYPTGDLCSISPDGHLFFKGRCGDMVKVNAANVLPSEVEQAIRAEVNVKSAVVFGLDGGAATADTLVAVLVPERDGTVVAANLKSQLRTRLASYKVPRHVLLMAEEDLPLTASGKIYMPRLRELARAMIAV